MNRKLSSREWARLLDARRGIVLQQVNSRGDGCTFHAIPSLDGKRLHVRMVSQVGTIVDQATIDSADFFSWMQSREDW